jgi:peptide/nickel transport system permease protein
VAWSILAESALSFLGFGAAPPTPTWGEVLAQAYQLPHCWWMAMFPGLMLFGLVSAINLVAAGAGSERRFSGGALL